MSKLLYRIGLSAYRKPWYFIAAWVVVLGAVIAALVLGGITVTSDVRIEGTESQMVLDRLAEEMPEASGDQGSVVFRAPAGGSLTTPESAQAILKGVIEVYSLDHVIDPTQAPGEDAVQSAAEGQTEESASAAMAAALGLPYGPLTIDGVPVPGVIVSADGTIALFQFQFDKQIHSLPESVAESVLAAVDEAVAGTGIEALPSESLNPLEPPIGVNEVAGVLVAGVILVLTLGSLIAAGLPIITALVGVGIGVGGAYALSSFVDMNSVTPVLALMIGLAVGIDYALFIVNRQRRLILFRDLDAREATGRAVGTAGSAVFFAGLTVIVALCGLAVIRMGFVTTLALVAAVTVFIAVLVALTLLPALLGLLGERICSSKAREKAQARREREHRGLAHRWVTLVARHRWVAIGAVVVVLGAATIPIASMELGIPSGASANKDSAARQGYDAISAGFGEGFNGPLVVVAEPAAGSGAITDETLYGLTLDLLSFDGIAVASPMTVSDTGSIAIFNVIPDTGPSDTATKELVRALRAPDSSIAQTYGVTLGVTGLTAINIDMSEKLGSVFPYYVAITVGLSLIILLLVFRSIAVPLKATLGFLLTIMATFGITTAVFQWGWLHQLLGFDTTGPLVSFMPIMLTGILFGLAMDYEVFLVSSMREAHVHGDRGADAVVHGFERTSRVVVAAAVVMISIFVGFIFTDDMMIKQFGFALALGVFIDAFLVRMTFVPAVMALLGERTWWLPRWLDKVMPNLDVEGDKLTAELERGED